MNRVKRIVTALLVCLCLGIIQAQAATIQVEAERNPVAVGEEFTVLFAVDGPVNGNPDFSSLGADFQVTGTSNSSNIQIINGRASQSASWRVRLYALKAGELEIPPIAFGSDMSPSLKLTVTEEIPQPGPANAQADILVELEADNPAPFVQQEVIITQRLLHSVALLPSQASMSHPELLNGKGLIHQLGKARNSTLIRNGLTYQVIERRYAVFPQVSGEMSIGRTVFEGVLDDPASRRRDPFGLRGKHVRRFSKPLTFQVMPQATTGVDHWLPAKSLTLNAYWQPPTNQLKAGEPVTLTLAVVAEGLLAEQLPALDVKPPVGIKAYSNQPDFRNDLGGDHVIGIREEKWVLIGTADGDYELPEIKLDWWNLQKGTPETARIPPTVLQVAGAVAAGAPASPASAQPTPAKPAAENAGQSSDAAANSLLEQPANANPPQVEGPAGDNPAWWSGIFDRSGWFWPLAVVGMLLVLLIGLFRHGKRDSRHTESPAQPVSRQPALVTLKQACQQNDANAALHALHAWLREDLQLSPPTIAHLREQADLPLRQALDELNTVLFASVQGVWDGRVLWQAVQGYGKDGRNKPKAASNNGLAAMYPD